MTEGIRKPDFDTANRKPGRQSLSHACACQLPLLKGVKKKDLSLKDLPPLFRKRGIFLFFDARREASGYKNRRGRDKFFTFLLLFFPCEKFFGIFFRNALQTFDKIRVIKYNIPRHVGLFLLNFSCIPGKPQKTDCIYREKSLLLQNPPVGKSKGGAPWIWAKKSGRCAIRRD